MSIPAELLTLEDEEKGEEWYEQRHKETLQHIGRHLAELVFKTPRSIKKEHVAFLNEVYPDRPANLPRTWQSIWTYLNSRSYGNSFQNLIRLFCYHDIIQRFDTNDVLAGRNYFDSDLYNIRHALFL